MIDMHETFDTIVSESRPDLRARVVWDNYSDAPYNDGGSPIVMFEYRGLRYTAAQIEKITSYVLPTDLIYGLDELVRRHDIDAKLIERYLRMFWGVTQVEWCHASDGSIFLSFDPRDWRDEVGAPVGSVDMSEWRAYLDGYVFGILIEQHVLLRTERRSVRGEPLGTEEGETWEEVDACWGFYGSEHVHEEARAMLADAEDTLPVS